jgi:16S rRNA (uracil1498-N3)-methyltransferase
VIRMAFAFDRVLDEERIVLTFEEQHYLGQVMRLREGWVEALISDRGLFRARLADGGTALLLADELINRAALSLEITLCPALLKRDLMDQVMEKGTEVGISRFQPWIGERSLVREVSAKKRERWQRIVKEASEQCRRPNLPSWLPLAQAADGLQLDDEEAGICWDPNGIELQQWWQEQRSIRRVKTVVGPEGGMTDRERSILTTRGFARVRLGPYVFRAENAGIFGALLLLWLSGDLGEPLP